jgi:hypothetical protein
MFLKKVKFTGTKMEIKGQGLYGIRSRLVIVIMYLQLGVTPLDRRA